MDLRDKVVVVTGGSSGIGQACALRSAFYRGKVAILDRDRENGEATLESIQRQGGIARFYRVDLSIYDDVKITVAQVAAEFGGIDVLAHCAGIQSYGTAFSTSKEEWHKILAIDLDSAFYITKSALPEMIKRGGGSIVITGSTQSLVADRNSAAYVVAKHAVVGLMRSIAVDFAKYNVRANCVLPGAIDTPMLRWAASQDTNPEQVITACHELALLGRMGDTGGSCERDCIFVEFSSLLCNRSHPSR